MRDWIAAAVQSVHPCAICHHQIMEQVKLTQYSHGAGCGCKISPQVLDVILKGNIAMPDNDKLIVGNHSKDDAAVLDMGNGTALIFLGEITTRKRIPCGLLAAESSQAYRTAKRMTLDSMLLRIRLRSMISMQPCCINLV